MMIMLFIILLVVFAFLSDGIILRTRNLINILNAMAVTCMLTTGVAMLMISGKIDLSTGANGTLCGMLLAYTLRAGMPLLPAILIALALGAVIGVVNAVLVNELNMAAFIATLATSSICTGFLFLIAQRGSIDVLNSTLQSYGRHLLFGYIPVTVIVSFILMICGGIIMHNSRFGRQIYLVGGNPKASMLSGVNPKRMSYQLFVICGLFSSAAGITLVSRTQSADIQGLAQHRFLGITAAVLGGISFGGGTGGMAGAFFGLLVLSTFNNGMVVMGANPYWRNIAEGMLLIVALTFDYFQMKQREKVVAR